MMKRIPLILVVCSMMYACTPKAETNPFFAEYETEYGAPPFGEIKTEHYEPAFLKGMEEQNANIDLIVRSEEPPTFDNTIAAMDYSSPILDRVGGVFFNLTSAETTPELTELSMKMAPLLSEHSDNIYLNKDLYERVNKVYGQREQLNLTTEQARMLDKVYKRFVRSGANLDDGKQQRLREINKELSGLTLKFTNNILNENNTIKIFVDNEEELAGLPDWFRQTAAEEAKEAGEEGKWLFTVRNASRLPLLQYSENRGLREKVYKAYINLGNNDNENDNKQVVTDVMKLRLEKANLLGYNTYAHYVLEERMAETPENVMNFLNNLWGYALAKAKEELSEMKQSFKATATKDSDFEAWDWWYYTEQLRKAKYDLDEAELKPYFRLENVRDGAFTVANKLYGITLNKITNVPVYHPDVETYRVDDADGSLIGLLYVDYFPRAGKRSGAWMNNYRDQYGQVRPIICNVCNFTKPVGTTPSLLTLDEVETLFHEFGHALHGLLSKCEYMTTSGTSVARDFVELPSQIMEHWATEPEVLKMYAVNYETGEVIPDELITKILNQKTFNQGFMTTELLAAAILDMELHNLTEINDLDPMAFEKTVMDKLGLIPQIAPRYRVTYFNHIMGGYAAGYYSYLWANVLDSDAFEVFKENGIFDKKTADSFRNNILSRGNSDNPMTLYMNFRGSEPQLDPMLRNRGIKENR